MVLNPYVAGGYFGQYKMMQKSLEFIETWANGYSSDITQQELSNEYQYDRVLMVLKIFVSLCLWRK